MTRYVCRNTLPGMPVIRPSKLCRRMMQARIDRASSALGFYDDPGTLEAVTDLLADLRHYCDALGFDMADCDRMAREHYLADKGGDL